MSLRLVNDINRPSITGRLSKKCVSAVSPSKAKSTLCRIANLRTIERFREAAETFGGDKQARVNAPS